MRISKDPADYRYVPPPERTRRVLLALRVALQALVMAGWILGLLKTFDLL